ncbi:RDD family protein [Mucilaginibacter robiniae]|uniref:RDD family protein n=1 Tax=Mucilaginibacter robiniae TaxID=2728022 RepID=A0A7L5DYB7_9SPHI|nr:RDD family protein [Mucilaginibacter robiniae]QJD95097.1 RDD family protein [Mucilaginibacter robiniae]
MDNFYIQENGEQLGPFSFDELTDRGLEPDTPVRINEGKWEKAADMSDFLEYFRYYGYYFPTEANLAGFGIRLLAYIIDYFTMVVILIIGITIYASITAPNVQLDDFIVKNQQFFQVAVAPIFMIVYFTLTAASPLSSSLGQAAFKLIIVDQNGRKVTFLRALGRGFGKFLSGFFFGVGFLGIFFSQYKQAFHDVMAKTYVIRKDVY